MSDQDTLVAQLIRDALDAELGARLAPPETAVPTSPAGRPRWLAPVAAAAAVLVVATGAAVFFGTRSDDATPPSGTSAPGVQITCMTGPQGDAAQDRALLVERAARLSDGATVVTDDHTVTVDVPGAKKTDVAALCTSNTLELRPLVARTVRISAALQDGGLAGSEGSLPATEAAYIRLSPAQRARIAGLMRIFRCPLGTSPEASVASTRAPVIACTTAGDAALLGVPIVPATGIKDATAQPPSARSGVEWTVTVTFDRGAARRWSAYTTAHNTGGGTATTATACGPASTPCADFVGVVHNGRAVSLPVTEQPITGGSVQITGNYTERTAKALAAALRTKPLPVPLAPVSVARLR